MRFGAMTKSAIALSVMIVTAGVAVAAGDPVAERQGDMKHIGIGMRDGAALASGKTPFTPAAAKAAMGGVATDIKDFGKSFPKGSDKDPKSGALPAIWTNRADFDKKVADFAKLATTAANATSQDEFRPAFAAVGTACKGCHDLYRKKA